MTWLLRTVVDDVSVHDILWYFVTALATDNHTAAATDADDKKSTPSIDEDSEVCMKSSKHCTCNILLVIH